MSTDTVKIELSTKMGGGLIPINFSNSFLIALIRELAIVADDGMSKDELSELASVIRSYLRRVIEAENNSRIDYFDNNSNKLIPILCSEFYDHIRNELVSRIIQYDIRKESLRDCFERILEVAE